MIASLLILSLIYSFSLLDPRYSLHVLFISVNWSCLCIQVPVTGHDCQPINIVLIYSFGLREPCHSSHMLCTVYGTGHTHLTWLPLRVLALTTISLCRNEQQGGAT